MSWLGAGLRAVTRGRNAHLQGQDIRSSREQEQQKIVEAQKMAMIKMALEEKQRRQVQSNADRSFGLDRDKFEFAKQPKPDDVNWQTQETEQGVVQVNPRTGEVRPLQLGSSALKPKPQKWQVFGPGSGVGSEHNWQVVQTDQGPVQVDPKSGRTRPIVGQGGEPVRPPVPPAVKTALLENRKSISVIDSAINAVKAHPQATGILRGRIDALDQRVDPKGVEARAGVADIGSLIIRDRSGAAVTASEFPRLRPFLPDANDSHSTVLKKLARMRQIIAEETASLESSIGASPSAPAGGGDRAAALRAKYGIN